MEPEQIAQLLASFQTITASNQQMMEKLQLQKNNAALAEGVTIGTGTAPKQAPNRMSDAVANIALTGIKIPLDMGENAEERLVNFHEWTEEVKEKMMVVDVTDKKRQTTIALMWGGKDMKDFAVE